MSTIDDLKTTLHHAADGPDHALGGRGAAVHQRVRVVRRRRRATLAGTLAAIVAVAGIGLGAGLMDDEGPRTIDPAHGLDVDPAVTWNDFEYAVVDAGRLELGADGPEILELPGDGDERRLVTLTTEGLGAGDVTVRGNGEILARASDALPATVDAQGEGRLRLEVSGAPAAAEPALTWAVYERTDDLPAGPSDGHAVWREEAQGRTLAVGAFSEPGVAELEVEQHARLDELSLSSYCRSAEKGLFLHVSRNGQTVTMGERCVADPQEDPTGSWSSWHGRRVATHTYRAWVTRDELGEGEPVSAPDIVVGLGLYADGPQVAVPGGRQPEVIENGTLWRRDSVRHLTSTAQTVPVDTRSGPVVVRQVHRLRELGAVVAQGERGRGLTTGSYIDGNGSTDLSLPAGDTYRLGIDTDPGGLTPPGAGAARDIDVTLVVYRPVG